MYLLKYYYNLLKCDNEVFGIPLQNKQTRTIIININ